jgi:hypothetical protein
MPSWRSVALRRSVLMAAVCAAALSAPAAARAQATPGTLVSACDGTIGCPNKINLKDSVDTITFQARLTAATPLNPATEKLKLSVRNANGVVYARKLPAGSLQAVGNGKFQYRDEAARQLGGFSRVTLRSLGGNVWRITVIAHGDLSNATVAPMTLVLLLGDDSFKTKNSWSVREFGWLLHLPATAPPTPTPSTTPTTTTTPTPTPTRTPTVTPTVISTQTPVPTPSIGPATPTPQPTVTPPPTPTPTPAPTPPYGSVFEAFVAPPGSLLQ